MCSIELFRVYMFLSHSKYHFYPLSNKAGEGEVGWGQGALQHCANQFICQFILSYLQNYEVNLNHVIIWTLDVPFGIVVLCPNFGVECKTNMIKCKFGPFLKKNKTIHLSVMYVSSPIFGYEIAKIVFKSSIITGMPKYSILCIKYLQRKWCFLDMNTFATYVGILSLAWPLMYLDLQIALEQKQYNLGIELLFETYLGSRLIWDQTLLVVNQSQFYPSSF